MKNIYVFHPLKMLTQFFLFHIPVKMNPYNPLQKNLNHTELNTKLKKILFVTPTKMEMGYFSSFIDRYPIKPYISGVGPVQSLYRLLTFLNKSKIPDLIILAGIGGAVREKGVFLGDVCIAKTEMLLDIGRCEENNINPLLSEGNKTTQMKFNLQKYWKNLLKDDIIKKSNLKIVKMITVCCATSNARRLDMLKSNFDFQIENMEGASVALICKRFNIPLIEIRGVSNYINDGKEFWDIDGSLKNTKEIIKKIIPNLI